MKTTTGKKITAMFASLAAIILADAALLAASRLSGTVDGVVFIIAEGLLAVIFAAALLISRYIKSKILAPIMRVTAAADAIKSGGESEIGDYSDADGEVESMTRALHSMTEKLRFDCADMEKTCKEIGVKRKIAAIVDSSGDIKEVFEQLASELCGSFDMFKTTIVYLYEGRYTAFSKISDKQSGSTGYFQFSNFKKVEELLRNRRIAFLNNYTASAQGADFLDQKSDSACLIPLRNNELFGAVIFENIGGRLKLSEETENMMTFVSDALCRCLTEKEWASRYTNSGASEKSGEETVTDKLRRLEFLDVDAALAAVGGLRDIYEQSVKVTLRLLPETVRKMDSYLENSEIKKFGIEAHGMKSVLRNIGAATLGSMAAWLENAAKSDEIDYCRENYPPFKELLLRFESEANTVFADNRTNKTEVDRGEFIKAIETAAEAAKSYDAVAALEAVNPLSEYAHDKETDDRLKKIIFALEEFKCEDAIKEMEVILNGGT